jgi:hypothetical protein
LVGNTTSRPICEVKQPQATLVLRSEMTREPGVLYSNFFFFALLRCPGVPRESEKRGAGGVLPTAGTQCEKTRRGGGHRTALAAQLLVGHTTSLPRLLSTDAKKVTVSVLYWYEELSSHLCDSNF